MVGHRAIRKIGYLVQKSFIVVISIGELTKVGVFDALSFFRGIKAGKDCSPRGEDLFLFLCFGRHLISGTKPFQFQL